MVPYHAYTDTQGLVTKFRVMQESTSPANRILEIHIVQHDMCSYGSTLATSTPRWSPSSSHPSTWEKDSPHRLCITNILGGAWKGEESSLAWK